MDEPNALMRWVMFHFAGGDALFVGFGVVLGISLLRERPTSAWRWTLLSLLAVIWGGLASPAWPLHILLSAAMVISAWRMLVHFRGMDSRWPRIMKWSTRIVLVTMAVGELLVTVKLSQVDPPNRLCVIADSVTAGLNDGEFTWPQRFAEQTGISVRDASQPGASLRSALKQAELLDDDRSPLVLEIGGNDLLSGLSVADFTRDCESLCQKVCTPGRVVWMCELPLPPFSSGYGTAQRRLCRRYEIRLIPKREMMRLLTTAGATVDSIHLSPRGQNLFCRMITHTTGIATRGEK